MCYWTALAVKCNEFLAAAAPVVVAAFPDTEEVPAVIQPHVKKRLAFCGGPEHSRHMRFIRRPFDWLDEWQEHPFFWAYLIAYSVIGNGIIIGLCVLIVWLLPSI